MQTDPDPSPSQSSAESAVGLTFVAAVLVSLFVAGSLGVVATWSAALKTGAGQEPEGDRGRLGHPPRSSAGKLSSPAFAS